MPHFLKSSSAAHKNTRDSGTVTSSHNTHLTSFLSCTRRPRFSKRQQSHLLVARALTLQIDIVVTVAVIGFRIVCPTRTRCICIWRRCVAWLVPRHRWREKSSIFLHGFGLLVLVISLMIYSTSDNTPFGFKCNNSENTKYNAVHARVN